MKATSFAISEDLNLNCFDFFDDMYCYEHGLQVLQEGPVQSYLFAYDVFITDVKTYEWQSNLCTTKQIGCGIRKWTYYRAILLKD